MIKRNTGVRGTLKNILLAGALGLSLLGGINKSHAQENANSSNAQRYEDIGKENDWIRSNIEEEARKQGEVLTQEREDGTFVITHPKYGSIEAKDLSEYISIMANSIKKSRENMEKGVSVLESEVERGYLSPERAKEAKTSLVKAIKNYELVKSMYGNLYYNNRSRFKREVDFFASDVREELIDTKTGEKIPYPGEMVDDFTEFAKKHQLDGNAKGGYRGSPYTGEFGKPLTKALEEIDEVIIKEVQQEIKTRRYVPWSGFGEKIDEFVHPNVGDNWEIILSIAGIMALGGGVLGIVFYKIGKEEKREQQEKENEKTRPEVEEPEPELEMINPWEVNFHNLNSGGKKE